MSKFSDQYFRDLAPRERRYDVRVSDQLVFCVFPNGVKAWVYLYDADGHVRRRTIGLFPDMGYEAALRALDPNRRIAALEASEQRRDPSALNRLEAILERMREKVSLRDVIAAGGTAIIAFTAFVLIGGRDDPPPRTSTTTVPATPAHTGPAGTAEPLTTGGPGPAGVGGITAERHTAAAGRIAVEEPGVAAAAGPDASAAAADSARFDNATGAPAADGALPTGETVALGAEADRDTAAPADLGANRVASAGPDAPPDPADTSAADEPPADAGNSGIQPGAPGADALAASPDEPPAVGSDRVAADSPPENEISATVPDETLRDAALAATPEEPAARSGADSPSAERGTTLAEAAAPTTVAPPETTTDMPEETATVEPGGAAIDAPEETAIVEQDESATDGPEQSAIVDSGETAAEGAEATATNGPKQALTERPQGTPTDDGLTAAAAETSTPAGAEAPVVGRNETMPAENRAPVSTAAGYVERALLASRIVDGEPVGPLPPSLALAPDGSRDVCFFMEVGENAGAVVVHRWIRDGVIAAEIPLEADSDPQGRIFSSRRVGADDVGAWRIDALSLDGQLIASTNFSVTAPTDAAARLADEQPTE